MMLKWLPRDVGPCMWFASSRSSFSYDNILALKRKAAAVPFYKIKNEPGELELVASRIADSTKPENEALRKRLVEKGTLPADEIPDPFRLPGQWAITAWDWMKWTEHRGTDPLEYIPFSHMEIENCYTFRDPSADWRPDVYEFMLFFGRRGTRWMGPFPPDDDPSRIEFLLEQWKEAARLFKPDFAFIDDYGVNVYKRIGKDFRRFAWGVTIYGPEFVKTLGKENLLSAPAWKVEELPWGAIWIQAAQSPFWSPPQASAAEEKNRVLAQAAKAIEKHLELDRAFPAPVQRRRPITAKNS